MRNNVSQFFLFAIFLFVGCNVGKEKNEKIVSLGNGIFKRIIYDNNSRKEEILIRNDNGELVLNGYSISYWSSTGKISDSVGYISGQKNGLQSVYYENGTLRKRQHYRSGILHGINEEFHPNGVIKKWTFFFNGKPAGQQVEFDSLERPKHIFLRSRRDEPIFDAYFDNGKLSKMIGIPFQKIDQSNSVFVGDTFRSTYIVIPLPPNTMTLKIKVYSLRNQLLKSTETNKFYLHNYNYCHDFEHSFNEPGKYIREVENVITNISNEIIKRDIVRDTITVMKR